MIDVHPMTNRREEWHVTVRGVSACRWARMCHETIVGPNRLELKPLDIELSTFERQLMCASPINPVDALLETKRYYNWPDVQDNFEIVRIKHECEVAGDFGLFGANYYECHVKLDGEFDPCAPFLMSRDLYRAQRFYATMRRYQPFDAEAFVESVKAFFRPTAHVAGHEYEACLSDTNEALDARWVRAHVDIFV